MSINAEYLEMHFLSKCTGIPKFCEWNVVIYASGNFPRCGWSQHYKSETSEVYWTIKSVIWDVVSSQLFTCTFELFHSHFLAHSFLLSQFLPDIGRLKIFFQNVAEMLITEKQTLIFQMNPSHEISYFYGGFKRHGLSTHTSLDLLGIKIST